MIDEILAIAEKEVGVEEEPRGSNWGSRVSEYLKCTGITFPAFWCASFVSWVFKQVYKDNCPIPITSSCDVLLRFARDKGILYSTPKKGDIFLTLKSEYDAIHTGLIRGFDSDEFFTYEGNASPEHGGRNGIGVFAKSRPLSRKYKFIRWAELAKEPVKWILQFPNKKQLETHYSDGTNLIKTRSFMNVLFGEKEVNEKLKYKADQLFWDNKLLDDDVLLIDGEAYSSIRELAEFCALKLEVDNTNKIIKITK